MDRTAHLGPWASPTQADRKMAEGALDILNVSHLKDKDYTEIIYTEISGVERQLVLIARALVQQPEILVMDEPTSNLDFGNQVRVLEQIKNLAQRGLGIIMTSHVPDHAFLAFTKVALMQKDSMINSDELKTYKQISF